MNRGIMDKTKLGSSWSTPYPHVIRVEFPDGTPLWLWRCQCGDGCLFFFWRTGENGKNCGGWRVPFWGAFFLFPSEGVPANAGSGELDLERCSWRCVMCLCLSAPRCRASKHSSCHPATQSPCHPNSTNRVVEDSSLVLELTEHASPPRLLFDLEMASSAVWASSSIIRWLTNE